ncbi:MAG: UbiX family flavin prenyltransferase [Sciscionella sp.]
MGAIVRRLIVGLSGASGAIFGVRLLQLLRCVPDVESHLIVSPAALQTLRYETDFDVEEVLSLADHRYSFRDLAAAPSSGSFRTAGMIVCPCSIRTLSGVANSSDDNLLIRAADVTLKERRRLVLAVRETPLHTGHLRLMVQASECGAVIAPPAPAFYARPDSIDDLVDHTVYRLLDLVDVEVPDENVERWPQARLPERIRAATPPHAADPRFIVGSGATVT